MFLLLSVSAASSLSHELLIISDLISPLSAIWLIIPWITALCPTPVPNSPCRPCSPAWRSTSRIQSFSCRSTRRTSTSKLWMGGETWDDVSEYERNTGYFHSDRGNMDYKKTGTDNEIFMATAVTPFSFAMYLLLVLLFCLLKNLVVVANHLLFQVIYYYYWNIFYYSN